MKIKEVIKRNARLFMQTTTSRDDFREKLHFQNLLNLGNIACSIQGDTENIYLLFSLPQERNG